jgi:hypothetical protein
MADLLARVTRVLVEIVAAMRRAVRPPTEA